MILDPLRPFFVYLGLYVLSFLVILSYTSILHPWYTNQIFACGTLLSWSPRTASCSPRSVWNYWPVMHQPTDTRGPTSKSTFPPSKTHPSFILILSQGPLALCAAAPGVCPPPESSAGVRTAGQESVRRGGTRAERHPEPGATHRISRSVSGARWAGVSGLSMVL